MRMDDITVLVVDINPDDFISVTGKMGGDVMLENHFNGGFPKGHHMDKEKCIIA